MTTRRACGSYCECYALPDGVRVGVPVLSEVALRCGRGDTTAGVRHLDSIVRARREADEQVGWMRDTVNVFPPFA